MVCGGGGVHQRNKSGTLPAGWTVTTIELFRRTVCQRVVAAAGSEKIVCMPTLHIDSVAFSHTGCVVQHFRPTVLR